MRLKKNAAQWSEKTNVKIQSRMQVFLSVEAYNLSL